MGADTDVYNARIDIILHQWSNGDQLVICLFI